MGKTYRWIRIGAGIGVILIDLILFLSLLIPWDWFSEEMIDGIGIVIPILAVVGIGYQFRSITDVLEEEDEKTERHTEFMNVSFMIKLIVGIAAAALILLIRIPNELVSTKDEKIIAILENRI